jgi:predicted CopG family antitoxin
MSKVIAVSDTVYSELQKMKNGYSFSKMIESLIQNKKRKGDISKLEQFFGVLSKEDAKEWLNEVNAGRKNARSRS